MWSPSLAGVARVERFETLLIDDTLLTDARLWRMALEAAAEYYFVALPYTALGAGGGGFDRALV
jgi:hypothetical protein